MCKQNTAIRIDIYLTQTFAWNLSKPKALIGCYYYHGWWYSHYVVLIL